MNKCEVTLMASAAVMDPMHDRNPLTKGNNTMSNGSVNGKSGGGIDGNSNENGKNRKNNGNNNAEDGEVGNKDKIGNDTFDSNSDDNCDEKKPLLKKGESATYPSKIKKTALKSFSSGIDTVTSTVSYMRPPKRSKARKDYQDKSHRIRNQERRKRQCRTIIVRSFADLVPLPKDVVQAVLDEVCRRGSFRLDMLDLGVVRHVINYLNPKAKEALAAPKVTAAKVTAAKVTAATETRYPTSRSISNDKHLFFNNHLLSPKSSQPLALLQSPLLSSLPLASLSPSLSSSLSSSSSSSSPLSCSYKTPISAFKRIDLDFLPLTPFGSPYKRILSDPVYADSELHEHITRRIATSSVLQPFLPPLMTLSTLSMTYRRTFLHPGFFTYDNHVTDDSITSSTVSEALSNRTVLDSDLFNPATRNRIINPYRTNNSNTNYYYSITNNVNPVITNDSSTVPGPRLMERDANLTRGNSSYISHAHPNDDTLSHSDNRHNDVVNGIAGAMNVANNRYHAVRNRPATSSSTSSTAISWLRSSFLNLSNGNSSTSTTNSNRNDSSDTISNNIRSAAVINGINRVNTVNRTPVNVRYSHSINHPNASSSILSSPSFPFAASTSSSFGEGIRSEATGFGSTEVVVIRDDPGAGIPKSDRLKLLRSCRGVRVLDLSFNEQVNSAAFHRLFFDPLPLELDPTSSSHPDPKPQSPLPFSLSLSPSLTDPPPLADALRALILHACDQVDDSTLVLISHGFPNLKMLDLSGCFQIRGPGVRALSTIGSKSDPPVESARNVPLLPAWVFQNAEGGKEE
eukprot:CAMPEP_0175068146 /NCGR_PEP_ID=MMETSP0052_2-20121109/17510_1 /TAXON_ID=51329 ORGANISM="Polytomella parva, Strain SAG 63-3" /NCGR_SAMPLE_ID=MMETSP0052_2 /ASSEMBLY_ACC=CAM_ASM_000194 /LENGTH=798 /DNA_ID=CAMNT_0016335143 /DNA_START=935 /DNA_END=3327 /DNA_ORIENTATION=+